MSILSFGLKAKNREHTTLEIIDTDDGIYIAIRYPSSNKRVCSALVDRNDFLQVVNYIQNKTFQNIQEENIIDINNLPRL